jgi:hypothetical protein
MDVDVFDAVELAHVELQPLCVVRIVRPATDAFCVAIHVTRFPYVDQLMRARIMSLSTALGRINV